MRRQLIALALFALPGAAAPVDLAEKVWNHGSVDCSGNRDPAIEVFQADSQTYIFRQNKCVHFEAPFMYILFGEHTVLVQDTGATADPSRFPLYETVHGLIARKSSRPLKVLVVHSHSHSDHTAADSQFRGKPGVTLVEPTSAAVRTYFGFKNWPQGSVTIDLGGRRLEVIPTPGHHDESLAIYDARTGWLLTGDSVYPGRLYVKDWREYRASIERLVEFSKTRSISAVLGSHIEMSEAGTLFQVGSTYQPHEASLVLSAQHLSQLNQALGRAGDSPKEVAMPKFVVTPIGAFRRVLSTVLEWFGVR
jgi:glyoxylase-like metal-dependent hydrolase (beta-lactamase superfamily II)